MRILRKVEKRILWTEYSFQDKNSHPPVPGRYMIWRYEASKVHFEAWNGSGWASTRNEPLFWATLEFPEVK